MGTLCLRAAIVIALPLCGFAPASAQQSSPPRLIPFQGRVTDLASNPVNGVETVTFTIYDAATNGVACWSEVQPGVSIVAGQISVFLGALTSLDAPGGGKPAVCFGPAGSGTPPASGQCGCGDKYLGIKLGLASNQEMVPRHQLVPAFHARRADIASATTEGAITSNMIARDAVGTENIANGTIQIEDLSIGARRVDASQFTPSVAGDGLTISGEALRVVPDNVTTEIVNDELRVRAGGIGLSKLASRPVSTPSANPGIGGIAVSARNSGFGTTTGSEVLIPGLTSKLATVGRPVLVLLVPSGQGGSIYAVKGGRSVEGSIVLRRNGEIVSGVQVGTSIYAPGNQYIDPIAGVRVPAGLVLAVDSPPPGSHEWTLSFRVSGPGNVELSVADVQLIALEL